MSENCGIGVADARQWKLAACWFIAHAAGSRRLYTQRRRIRYVLAALQAGDAAKGAGRTYQRTTGRDAESDSKVAGIVAVAGGTIIAAGVCSHHTSGSVLSCGLEPKS